MACFGKFFRIVPCKRNLKLRLRSLSYNNLRLCCSCVTDCKISSPQCRNISYALFRHKAFHTTASQNEIVPFLLADIGEGIKEVIIKEWYVKVGDKVAQFDSLCEVQSDKASVTITSRYDGILKKLYYDVDDTALVGKPLVDIEATGEGEMTTALEEVQEQEAITVGTSTGSSRLSADQFVLPMGKALATPAVRRLAMEYKLSLSDILGTGKDGRILKEDVLNYIEGKKRVTKKGSTVYENETPTEMPDVSVTPVKSLPPSVPVILGKDRTESVRGFRKAMVKSMTAAMEIPHFNICDEVDVASLVGLRGQMKKYAESHGVKFSYMPVFIKAASISLTHFPVINSSVDRNCDNITYKASHNIGIAMDTQDGLIVPNIKGVQNLNVLEIAEELNRLQELGLKGALKTDDITGGTFTLSNIGSIGGTYAKAVILPPEVAIGVLGKIQVLPRFDSSGNVKPFHIMKISWSADHRIIDGATMTRFSNLFKSLVETPAMMLLSMK